jgi:hypothetical protein
LKFAESEAGGDLRGEVLAYEKKWPKERCAPDKHVLMGLKSSGKTTIQLGLDSNLV